MVSFSQVPNYVPSTGLVGWWPFNGNANDESVNANSGTVNGATLTTDRFGNGNSAYYFNGGNWIEISSNGLNGIYNNDSRSISFWAYIEDTSSTQRNLISYGGPCLGQYGNSFRITSIGCNSFNLNFDGSNYQKHINNVHPSNQWNHYVHI